MKTNFEKILDFHARFDVPDFNPDVELPRRAALLKEEAREADEAMREVLEATPENKLKAVAHLLKELGDVLYVTYGTLAILGVDGDAVFEEVHASNMSKTPNPNPEISRKAIKGPGYKPAEMETFVR